MSKWDEMRAASPGDVIGEGRITFVVREVVDGHVWGNLTSSMIIGECCRVCGMMRRADKKNKPCKGPAKIELR